MLLGGPIAQRSPVLRDLCALTRPVPACRRRDSFDLLEGSRYALALPSHVPAETAKGFTLSLAKQVLTGKMDDVIDTIEHNVRLL